MKKNLRVLLILSGVLVILLALWVALVLVPESGPGDETSAATTRSQSVLFTVDPAEVARIAVHNNFADLTLLPERTQDASGQPLITWKLAEDQGLPISQTILSDLAEAALSMTYSEVIVDNPDDLAAFGLNRPSSTISIVFPNGSSKTIEFGSSLSSGKGVYARISQDTRIYAVDSQFKDQASQSLADLVDLSQAIGGLATTDLSGMTFFRRDDLLRLQAAITPTSPEDPAAGLTFNLTAPVARPGNPDTLTSLLQSILKLSAVRMVDLDASNLERFGLVEPKYQITLETLTGKEVVISIGDSAGSGQYYVTSTALPAIMTVQADALTAVDLPLTDYVDRFVALMSIWKVSSVLIDLEGEQHELGLSIEEGQKTTDEAVELTFDGQNAKIVSQTGENLFSKFYQTLIGIRIDGFDLAASPESPATSRITYALKPDPETQSDARTLVIEFVTRDAYTDYVLIDGSYTGFYISHRDVFTSEQVGLEGLQLAVLQLQYAIDHAVDGVFDTSKGYPAIS
ncbi:MAG: DUF4340 domain-containing protein [Clostridia bacterium]|nr:DUF4340 domain-containing protein [Clostridia bacterium]NCC75270.1 DUF4340 domain-containing protein [Clostridia bacterium]